MCRYPARSGAKLESKNVERVQNRDTLCLAAGPHPRRELTLTPSLGFPCPHSGVAAGAPALACGAPPQRELTPILASDPHVLGHPFSRISMARRAEAATARRRVLAQVWPQALLFGAERVEESGVHGGPGRDGGSHESGHEDRDQCQRRCGADWERPPRSSTAGMMATSAHAVPTPRPTTSISRLSAMTMSRRRGRP